VTVIFEQIVCDIIHPSIYFISDNWGL